MRTDASRGGGETIVRRVSQAEADATVAAGGLVPRPGSRGAKRVSSGRPQALLPRKGHEKTVTLTVQPGTTQMLRLIRFQFGLGESGQSVGACLKNGAGGRNHQFGCGDPICLLLTFRPALLVRASVGLAFEGKDPRRRAASHPAGAIRASSKRLGHSSTARFDVTRITPCSYLQWMIS